LPGENRPTPPPPTPPFRLLILKSKPSQHFKYLDRMDNSILNLIISSLITGAVGLFSYGTIKMYLLRSRYRHIPGPPTKGILGFYLGNVFEIAKAYQDNKLLNDFILEELFSNLNIIFFNCIN
jgi:hypothetical protein